MSNHSDATEDIQKIAESLPDKTDKRPADVKPSVTDSVGKTVQLDRSKLHSQRPVTGIFSTDRTFTKVEPEVEK